MYFKKLIIQMNAAKSAIKAIKQLKILTLIINIIWNIFFTLNAFKNIYALHALFLEIVLRKKRIDGGELLPLFLPTFCI